MSHNHSVVAEKQAYSERIEETSSHCDKLQGGQQQNESCQVDGGEALEMNLDQQKASPLSVKWERAKLRLRRLKALVHKELLLQRQKALLQGLAQMGSLAGTQQLKPGRLQKGTASNSRQKPENLRRKALKNCRKLRLQNVPKDVIKRMKAGICEETQND